VRTATARSIKSPTGLVGFSTADLRGLFDAAPFGVIAIDPAGRIQYVNPRQCENSGLRPEDFLGKAHRATFGAVLERAGLLPSYDQLIEDGTPFEKTVLDYKRYVDDVAVAFNLRGYRAGCWTFLVTSIERALANQQARYLQIFENANDGIFLLSREGRFVSANRAFTEMVGVPLESLIGETAEMFLPGRFEQSRERLERIMREGRLGPYELEVSTPLGPKFISLNGFAWIEDGEAVGVINIARDMTEDHRRADELRAARDKALEASRLKSSVLANVTHELRTPVNIILGYSSLVAGYLQEKRDSSQSEMLEGIRRAGRRLRATINSILDASKIESGAFEVHPERLWLAPLIERQLQDFRPLAHSKNLSLSSDIEAFDAEVTFDAYCLENALTNLLANAVKFTSRGEVRVRLARDERGSLALSVRDTGIGIDPSFVARLGEAFAQEDSGLGRRFEGSGLGIALTKSYLELNAARLSVESEKDVGSQFTIHFADEARAENSASVVDREAVTVGAPGNRRLIGWS
jgi:PAS domain S-box-containing protein